ncbi:hypothetical protein [Novipirellula artificiosorum]|uniref:Uncharacterized protein n=1 Tax=Novipirellula artificiosorum TaxID=2528016 RepID=A0A5C6DUF6_9BACT|nr:hypothetical protein [Novipirellula artificiosorum]TWU38399.1 hypothetical protein Poly41_28750 [Novipirellula artificiosorum]
MSDDFNARLESAIERGKHRASQKVSAERQQELTAEELKRMHSSLRLSLSERIEKSIHRVADHFPGFRVESLIGETGWGSACYRDDLRIAAGRRSNQYSRLEIAIPAYSDLQVLELRGKGTVMNRELFNRNHFVPISEADEVAFEKMIDAWAIEYAEVYAAKSSL